MRESRNLNIKEENEMENRIYQHINKKEDKEEGNCTGKKKKV